MVINGATITNDTALARPGQGAARHLRLVIDVATITFYGDRCHNDHQ
jgi:hypothetical protein